MPIAKASFTSRHWVMFALSRCAEALRFADPSAPTPPPDAKTEEALARLAALSPHLLEDIGFTRDRHRSTAGRTVWTDGVRDFVVIDASGPAP
ncbi:protein of unknown function [Cribrihabitans marinus]|uniref:DUF1127 domain-containing protein n=1 Tax=Cribrihabitans marinus TaxID=1227549 RepID=A0A1H7B0W8_9RHOB|nr:hypothetical protein GCM10010973_23410 [Cribrihabitans marinus]SEJ66995.1 protein of unknown function [Cribrihabitans marinus]